jgi:hypothetical protein
MVGNIIRMLARAPKSRAGCHFIARQSAEAISESIGDAEFH